MNPSEAPEGTIAVLAKSFCAHCIKHGQPDSLRMDECVKKYKCIADSRKDRCNVYYIPAPKHYVKKEEIPNDRKSK